MLIRLPDGSELRLGVNHIRDKHGRRGTKVWIRTSDGMVNREVFAMCSEQDNFCKRTGRKLAADRLLKLLRWEELTCGELREYTRKPIRRQLFKAVCPEFHQGSAGKKKHGSSLDRRRETKA